MKVCFSFYTSFIFTTFKHIFMAHPHFLDAWPNNTLLIALLFKYPAYQPSHFHLERIDISYTPYLLHCISPLLDFFSYLLAM